MDAPASCVSNKLINSVRQFTAGLVNSLNADTTICYLTQTTSNS